MICNAVYDSLEAIPEAFRAEFERRTDGKYYLKADAVPGAAEILNPGLAQNRDRLKTQKEAAETRATNAETKARELETELVNVRAPGSVILSGDDAKAWAKYTKLGDAKTVEKIVSVDFPKLQKDAAAREGEKAFAEAVEDLTQFGVTLNFDVLRDLMTHPQHGEGLQIERRPVEVENTQGQKVTVNFPHILTRTPVAGKENEFTVTATPLLDFAKAKWPSWAVTALTAAQSETGAGASTGGQQFGQQQQTGGVNLIPLQTGAGAPANGAAGGGAPAFTLPGQQGGGLRLPLMTGGASAGGAGSSANALDAQKKVEEFNARRSGGKVNPLAPRTAQTQTPSNSGGAK